MWSHHTHAIARTGDGTESYWPSPRNDMLCTFSLTLRSTVLQDAMGEGRLLQDRSADEWPRQDTSAGRSWATQTTHAETRIGVSPPWAYTGFRFRQWHRVCAGSMGLHEDRIKLTDKGLIGCRDCSAVADVSIRGSNVKLICPNCHGTLGTWETTAAASADLTAFIGKRGARVDSQRGKASPPH